MLRTIRNALTFSNVIAMIALFAALSGGAYAAVTLPKNSVGTKQIKKNAVTSAKIKANSVTGAKVKDASLTGADINLSTLPKVGSAANADRAANADNAVRAANADNATTAGRATTADVATTAQNLAPPEAWREIGAPGEPGFEGGTTNFGSLPSTNTNAETAAFFKDKEGIVHLKGLVKTANSGTNAGFLFYLPEGYRPAERKLLAFNALCTTYSGGTGTCSGDSENSLLIIGPGSDIGGGSVNTDGLVFVSTPGVAIGLDGISFRPGA